MQITVNKPSENLNEAIRKEIWDWLQSEYQNTIIQIQAQLHRLKPGQKKVILSKPMRFVISRSKDENGARP